jgi:AhpD family alkylhydroperoxidase
MTMVGVVVRAALRKSLNQIRHVVAVRPADARGVVADVYRQSQRDFGMLAPPVALHSPAPRTLAAVWTMLRETLLANGGVDRATKEAVAAAVSVANACPYCVDVHGTAVAALAGGNRFPRVEAWVNGTGPAPGEPDHRPELVGVAVTFHYLNRMVNVFLPDSPLPGGLPRGPGLSVFGRFIRTTARTPVRPGESLDLLPAAPLPADLSWAAGHPVVARAFGAAAAAFDGGVPDSVRDLLATTTDGARGIGRAWVDDLLTSLPPADRPAGRVALLTAFASYQLDDSVIGEFRRDHPDDRSLVELTAWASFTAARRLGAAMN